MKLRGPADLWQAWVWSYKGLRAALKYEAAFRSEVVGAIIAIPVGLWLGETNVERALLVGCVLVVLIVEMLNSAIETTVDRVGKDHHKLSGRAKDMGSGAVFLSLVLAAVTWAIILFT
ncbi:MAG: diacylglycerol kinase [Gammaproteobacteria bacterium]|nr:MAG: diacylglycerol kinase [Gammaproteobacteria bacterium]